MVTGLVVAATGVGTRMRLGAVVVVAVVLVAAVVVAGAVMVVATVLVRGVVIGAAAAGGGSAAGVAVADAADGAVGWARGLLGKPGKLQPARRQRESSRAAGIFIEFTMVSFRYITSFVLVWLENGNRISSMPPKKAAKR